LREFKLDSLFLFPKPQKLKQERFNSESFWPSRWLCPSLIALCCCCCSFQCWSAFLAERSVSWHKKSNKLKCKLKHGFRYLYVKWTNKTWLFIEKVHFLGCRKNLDNLETLPSESGYNPFFSDNMDPSGDPGLMNGMIFFAQCEFFNRQYNAGHRDFFSVRKDLRCDATMKTKRFKWDFFLKLTFSKIF